jgi:hypothetical protein
MTMMDASTAAASADPRTDTQAYLEQNQLAEILQVHLRQLAVAAAAAAAAAVAAVAATAAPPAPAARMRQPSDCPLWPPRWCSQGLLAELLFLKPADPRAHVIAALERMKVAGNKPLLNMQDLAVVFGMLDVTKRGAVSEQEAHATLRTVLGAAAAGAAAQPGAATAALDAGAFTQFMTQALAAATPLCKNGGVVVE